MEKLALKRIGEKEFDYLTFESENPALVFFGARRCMVCRDQLPIVEEIAYEYKDKFSSYWVDVDRNKPLFRRFRLQGIPNIVIFNEGEIKEKIRGLNSKETLIQILRNVI
jgi:thioredoxin